MSHALLTGLVDGLEPLPVGRVPAAPSGLFVPNGPVPCVGCDVEHPSPSASSGCLDFGSSANGRDDLPADQLDCLGVLVQQVLEHHPVDACVGERLKALDRLCWG